MAFPFPSKKVGSNYPGVSRADRTPHRIFVVADQQLPQAPKAIDKDRARQRLRARKDGHPNYWCGVDWRTWFEKEAPSHLKDALTVLDQGDTDACAGFAAAAALRANLAIHRNVNEEFNAHFIWGVARERDERLADGRARLLQAALLAANTYGIPYPGKPTPAVVAAGGMLGKIQQYALEFQGLQGHRDAGIRKIQGIVDLGAYLGDVSAWLHAFGPVAVHMVLDRESFRAIGSGRRRAEPPMIQYGDDADAYDGQLNSAFVAHDAVLVGYIANGDPRYPRPLHDSFIVMNSYGPRWGEGGFAYIKVDEARQCFRAVYGLLLREHLGYQHGGTPCRPARSLLSAAASEEEVAAAAPGVRKSRR
jgi:hypothetical protein